MTAIKVFTLSCVDRGGQFSGARFADAPYTRCKACGFVKVQREEPVTLHPDESRWNPLEQSLGDFLWPGSLEDVFVWEHVKQQLPFEELSFSPARFDLSNLSRRRQAIVARHLPPDDRLWRVHVDRRICLNLERSGRKLKLHCPSCGNRLYDVAPGSGYVIDHSSWDGSQVFHLQEAPVPLFVTDKARSWLEKQDFANVRCMPAGEILA